MAKKSFTTRLDESVLALAQKLAESERRSVTAILELAVLEYAARRGLDQAAEAAGENSSFSA